MNGDTDKAKAIDWYYCPECRAISSNRECGKCGTEVAKTGWLIKVESRDT